MDSASSHILLSAQHAKVSAGNKNLWVMPLAADRVRFVYSISDQLSAHKSDILIDQPAFTDWTATEMSEAGELQISTRMLKIQISCVSFQVAVYDRQGNLLYRENPCKIKEIEPIEVVRSRSSNPDQLKMEVTVDGLRVRAQNLDTYVDRMAAQVRLHFDFQEDEALYGLGSHEDGTGNLRGSRQYIYQQNMKACVPVLVSSKGYGLLFDSGCLMTFRDDQYGSYMWFETVDQLDYVFYKGETLEALNAQYYALTGQPPLLPRWSFGYVQSKERYIDAAELIETVQEYRRREIPLDCIVLDWRSWEGDLWGEKKYDPKRFPDPKSMVEQLHALKTKMMISIWPNMAPGGTNSAQMIEKGFMLGNQSTYDAFNKDARSLYWQQASAGLFSSGLDAWWCDCTEPFEGDWKGEIKPEPEARIAINCDEARRYLDPAKINAYSLLHSRGIYEGQRSETAQKRVINLTRSSYAGQHRYATVTWSGDTAATWDMIKAQITAATNFCVTGEPYWTLDIGAFFVMNKEQWFWSGNYDQGCEDPAYREFYLRMFQFAAFLPMFRSHGTDTPREVWRFGEPGEVVYDSLLRFMRLRYRLLPYIYSLAGQITHKAGFMIAPPGMVFPNDQKAHAADDAFMLGNALLIHPITDPWFYDDRNCGAGNQTTIDTASAEKPKVSVYLPAGTDWFDFWTGQRYDGGQTVVLNVSLKTIPVFVRAGSILPMAAAGKAEGACCTDEIDYNELDISIYAGSDCCFDLYEDEGDGYGYESGQYAFTRFQWSEAEQKLTSEISGDFTGFNAEKLLSIKVIA